jgi:hypothetical protein
MRNQGVLFLGLLLILFGGLALATNLLHIDFGMICWPAGLILLGAWLLLRPRLISPGTFLDIRPFGDFKRRGAWTVKSEEFWSFIGDTRLDMSEAEIPEGETSLRAYGFIGNIRLRLPQDVGFALASTAFLNETRILGDKQETFLAPMQYTSPNYESAGRKVHLETWFFIADIRIEQA